MLLLPTFSAALASPISAPATIAGPDAGPATADPAAIHYNPAAIGATEGVDVLVDVQLSKIDITFEPSRNDGIDPNTGDKYAPGEAHVLVPVGLLGATWKPSKWFAVGFAATDSFVGGGDYSSTETDPPPYTGSQRYAGIKTQIITASLIPAVAINPTPWLHVGGSFSYVYDKISLLKASDPLGTEGVGFTGTPYEYDVILSLEGSGSHTAWSAGVFFDRWKWLQLGASYSSEGMFSTAGEAELTAPDALAAGSGSVTIPGTFTFEMPLASVFRAGANSQINDKLKVGATVEYYMWRDCCGAPSGDAKITLLSEDGDAMGPDDGLSITVADTIYSPRRLYNNLVIAGSGGYQITPALWAGTRLGWKQYAVPDYAVSATNLDFDVYGAMLAARYKFGKHVGVGASYTYNYLVTREITNSAWDVRDEEDPDYKDDRFTTETPYNTSGNGTYSGKSMIFGARLFLDF